MQHKLVFIETQDVVETTLALDNYRRACDCGRGAVFFSVARSVLIKGLACTCSPSEFGVHFHLALNWDRFKIYDSLAECAG